MSKFLTFRRATAVASVALAGLALTGCSLISGVLNGGTPGEADVFTLKVGDCLNDNAKEGDIDTLPVVDCEKPHDSEIYASIALDEGDYPGDTEIADTADQSCYDEYETFVGVIWDDSKYNFATIFPTEESWKAGDREVLCRIVLANEDGTIEKVTGSLKGINE